MPASDYPQPSQTSKAQPPPFVPSPTSTRHIAAGFVPSVSPEGIRQQVYDRLMDVKEALILLAEYEHAATVQDVALKLLAPKLPPSAPTSSFPPMPWKHNPKPQEPFPPDVVVYKNTDPLP